MKKVTPRISVIIPTRNDENRIGRSITSVLMQSFEDFEILVINDASSDNTAAIIENYRCKDTRIRVVTNSTQIGAAKCRNMAMKMAQSELVANIDSDDFMMPDRLEKQYNLMTKREHIGFVSAWAFFDMHGGKYVVASTPIGSEAIKQELMSGHNNVIIDSALMARRSLFLSQGGYREHPCSPNYNYDYYTFLGLAPHIQFAVIPEPLIVVDIGGLIEGRRIKQKLRELDYLETDIYSQLPSTRRLLRRYLRKILLLLPQKSLGDFYYWRLQQRSCANQSDSLNVWINELERQRRVIEDLT